MAHLPPPKPASGARSEPSFDPFGADEEQYADQDHEAYRRVGPGQIVALGELVDELAQTTEVDEEFNAHNVDERKDHAEPHADEDGRQRRAKQNFPVELRGREFKAS